VQLILKTFVEVILLRKGPGDIPNSMLLLGMAVFMVVLSRLLLHAMIETEYTSDLVLDFAAELIRVGCYVAILFATGYIGRVAQTMTAIIGCTAIMVFLFVAVFMLSRPFVGYEMAGAIAWFVAPWMILVEGHIISRAIQRHWFTGIAIAVVIFILQLSFYLKFSQVAEGPVT
jgi:hypothetical protein